MKFLVVVLFAIILAANAKVILLSDMVKAYEETNGIGHKSLVANEALFIPTTLTTCDNSSCNYICQMLGYKHGNCVSSTTCNCYN